MDIFAKIGLINFLVSIFLGVQIIVRKRDWANWAFCLLASSIAFWSFGYWQWLSSYDPVKALFWVKIFTVGSILIPVFFLHWVVVLLGYGKKYLRLIVLLVVVSLTLVFNTFFTELIIKGTQQKLIFPFWPIPGTLYAFYVFFIYIGLVSWALVVLLREFKKTDDHNKKFQIKYIFWGSLIGFGGGITNFFLWYGILAPPYLNFLVGVGLIIFYYAASKSSLFEVKVIATEFFAYLLGMAATIRFVFDSGLRDWTIDGIVLFLVFFVGNQLIKSVRNEIRQREEVQKLAKNLEAANIQQESLIHFITHQVKGFLSKSRDIFSMELEGDFGSMPEAVRVVAKEGFDSGTKGVEYVLSILKGQSAQSGSLPYNMQPIDIKSVIQKILPGQKEAAEKAGLSFESTFADGDYNTTGDPTLLEEIFKNLITNATRYNNPNGNVNVSLSRTGNKIIFAVKDTGIGISKEDEPRLFRPGGMGKDSVKHNVEASGFGLAFVKPVVERHQGRVWYKSNSPEKGTTFFVELPTKLT